LTSWLILVNRKIARRPVRAGGKDELLLVDDNGFRTKRSHHCGTLKGKPIGGYDIWKLAIHFSRGGAVYLDKSISAGPGGGRHLGARENHSIRYNYLFNRCH
jgi:hypothetical protein